jgi:hypothetical protein
MLPLIRSFLPFILLLSVLAAAAACGDDGDSGSDSDSSPTPFIASEALTTAQALALLDEIETSVREPNVALVALAQVSEGEVQERSLRILNGVDDVSGLDDVRGSLESADRVGAGEYLFNVVRDDTAPLSDPDTSEISEPTLDEVDPMSTFDEDHGDHMAISGVYKDAVLKMMELWYGLLGVPPEDTPEPS